MNRTMKLAATVAVFGGLMALMGAPAVSADTEGRYWKNQEGATWRTGFGACWGSHYAPEGYQAGCDPEPKAETQSVEVAAVENPEPTYTSVDLKAVTLFAFNSDQLRPEGVEAINQLAGQAKSAVRVNRVYVAGYTDSTGPEAYNQGLSERRADAVKAQLMKAGIDENLIQARGFGESDPVASNATKAGRQENRRVQVEVTALR
jgi:OOP family OmpA-OmpF porin